MLCYPCHPDVGTGEQTKICPSMCDTWFDACKTEFYSAGIDGSMVPCLDDSVICSPLSLIVHNGKSLCRRMGLDVTEPEYPINLEVNSLFSFDLRVSADARRAEPCFNGLAPSAAGAGGAYADSNHGYGQPLGSPLAESGSDEADEPTPAYVQSNQSKPKKDAKGSGYSEFTSIVASDAPSVGGVAPFSI